MLDVPQSIHRATLILIAKATGAARTKASQQPAFDTLEVESVLKGGYTGKTIRVKSWYGMCDYGFVLEKGTYVVLLSQEGENYTSVHNGCAYKAFPIRGGKAVVGDWIVSPKDLIEFGGIPPGRNRRVKTK